MSTAEMKPTEVHGYAIISDDDKIAGADGLIPASLRNEHDWRYYQDALARSDLIVFGHRSHLAEPNERGDLRLVVTSRVDGLERRPDGWWWNPAKVAWPEAVERVLPQGGNIAAPGGQGVFDLFLGIGYDVFHLSHAHGVSLPGGRFIFSACDKGVSAATVLTNAGLRVRETLPLDPAHGVEMNIWRATGKRGAPR